MMCCLYRADEWVLKGISGYIYGLYLKKTFGVNDYRHWIKEVTLFRCLFCHNTGFHPGNGLVALAGAAEGLQQPFFPTVSLHFLQESLLFFPPLNFAN